MPWQECSAMSLRQEFVALAQQPESNFSQRCRRFGISCKTGYKWLQRYRESGASGLADRSRRPKHSPRRSQPAIEQQVLSIRDEHGWGARKIQTRIARAGQAPVARSTVHANLLALERVSNSPDQVS